jgi:hypothetical protein
MIWRERTFYSHPAIVDVDHIIRHFPEHRKLALLADEPPPAAFNAFTIAPATYALGLFIASAGFDGARRSGGRVHLRAWECPDAALAQDDGSGVLEAQRGPAGLRPPRPAP